MAIEKLKYEDSMMFENVIDKLNEVIDNINELEEHYNRRINNIYKFIRLLKEPKDGEK